MPMYCQVAGCKSIFIKGSNIAFHTFPKDETLRSKWSNLSGKKGCIISPTARICTKHFESSAFERHLKYELLGLPVPYSQIRFKPGALPTLHLPAQAASESESKRGRKRVRDDDDTKVTEQQTNRDASYQNNLQDDATVNTDAPLKEIGANLRYLPDVSSNRFVRAEKRGIKKTVAELLSSCSTSHIVENDGEVGGVMGKASKDIDTNPESVILQANVATEPRKPNTKRKVLAEDPKRLPRVSELQISEPQTLNPVMQKPSIIVRDETLQVPGKRPMNKRAKKASVEVKPEKPDIPESPTKPSDPKDPTKPSDPEDLTKPAVKDYWGESDELMSDASIIDIVKEEVEITDEMYEETVHHEEPSYMTHPSAESMRAASTPLEYVPVPVESPALDFGRPTSLATTSDPLTLMPRRTSCDMPGLNNSTPEHHHHQQQQQVDEFQQFGLTVAAQLRSMPLRAALEVQLEIQKLITTKRVQLMQ